MTSIPPKAPFVLPVVLPVRFDEIPYEGEIWYDATGRMLNPEEVCNALNSREPQSRPQGDQDA